MTIEELAGVHREIHVAEGEVLLETKDLTVKFGGLVALDSTMATLPICEWPSKHHASNCLTRRCESVYSGN